MSDSFLIEIGKAPILRFLLYEDPWVAHRLIDVVDMFDSLHVTPKKYVAAGYPMIRVADIKDRPIDFQACLKVTKDVYEQFTSRYQPEKGDIVLSRVGTCGSSAYLETNEQTCLGQNTVLLHSKINSVFLLQLIRSPVIQKQVEQRVVGSSHKTLSLTHLKEFRIFHPQVVEQQKIADFLTAVDTRIGQLSEKKTLLEAYKKGVMQQLFTQAIRFKGDDGSEYPEWEEKKLGEIAEFLKGKGISKLEVIEGGATPCIRYGELYTDYSELILKVKSRTDVPTKDLVLSVANDVILPASGETHIDIATASCVKGDGVALGGDLNILRTKQDGLFLAYYLNNACKQAIASVAQGSSVIHLYSVQLKSLTISLPSVDEQIKIAIFLSAIDLKIESVASQIADTKTFKKGLLQQMFV